MEKQMGHDMEAGKEGGLLLMVPKDRQDTPGAYPYKKFRGIRHYIFCIGAAWRLRGMGLGYVEE